MYLSLLSKEEKFYFIDLLIKVVSIDGGTNETELQVINRLKYEMGEDMSKYKKSNTSTEKLIEYFAQKSKITKNLVYMNLVSASIFDDFYSVEEHLLLEEIQQALDINDKVKAELMRVIYAERDLRNKALKAISG
ncbi:MAG: hypothetical protein PHT83_00220 [Bacilli bacterium]|nr:hypothetical protein [Bacilli bacterium]